MTLVVTNSIASDQVSAPAVVDPLPAAAFHWTADDLVVTFGNDSQDANAFLWAFGDGVTSTLPAPTHTYPISGTYLVTLTAYNGCGEDIVAETVHVTAEYSWHVYLPLVIK